MRCFAAVEEERGFAAAARRLGLSKAQVSKQVSALESHLGCRLLQRTTRRLSLTEPGGVYLAHCRAFLEQNAAMEERLAEAGTQPRGTLRVSAPLSYGQLRLAPLIGDFLTRHPDLRLEMDLNDRFVDLVEEAYDVTIRVGGDPSPSLVARKIAETRHGLFASPDYLRGAGRPATLADLAGHRCLAYSHDANPRPWHLAERTITPNWQLKSNNGDLLRQVALDGGGIVWLPDFFTADDLAAGRLVEIDLGRGNDGQAVLVLYPHRQHLPLKVRVFIDYLAEVLRGAPAALS